jgi:hypothetical protein
MDTAFHHGCTISAAGSIGGREVLQSSRAHLSRGPNRFSPSERRQPLGLRPLASGRSAIVVARRRGLRAAVLVRAAASEPLRHARSSLGRDRRDGRALRALAPRGGQLRLLSRATFLRWHACSLQTSTVVWRLAVQMKPRDPKAAMLGNLRLLSQRVCAGRCVFSGPSTEHRPSGKATISVREISDSQIRHCPGPWQDRDPAQALLTAQAGKQGLTVLARGYSRESYSRKKMTRYRLGRNAATSGLRTQRLREAR